MTTSSEEQQQKQINWRTTLQGWSLLYFCRLSQCRSCAELKQHRGTQNCVIFLSDQIKKLRLFLFLFFFWLFLRKQKLIWVNTSFSHLRVSQTCPRSQHTLWYLPQAHDFGSDIFVCVSDAQFSLKQKLIYKDNPILAGLCYYMFLLCKQFVWGMSMLCHPEGSPKQTSCR